MIIKNGLVFEASGNFSKNNILIESGKIISVENGKDYGAGKISNCIDAAGMYVIPGLIDIHFHGCMGYDFCDGTKESLKAIADAELTWGITSICPASMTFNEEKLSAVFENAVHYDNKSGAKLAGINMEGPFISPRMAGAQNPEYICNADKDMFIRLQKKAKGLIRVVNVAPETEGAIEFIKDAVNSVKVSIAHTEADYDTATEAFKAGSDHVTHLFNAMPHFHHRAPGVIGAAADFEKVYVEIITDGIHVDAAAVRTVFKIFGDDRIIFISDSMEACGMPDGQYELGGQKVYVSANKAELTDGTIAGSVTNLRECLKNAVFNMGIPMEKAVKCATVNPAKSIGIYDCCGSIEEGKCADIVILDKALNVKYVILDGKVVRDFTGRQ